MSMLNDRKSKNEWAMDLALVTSKRSTCCRRAVGCVLLNSKGHVIATGFNGVAPGAPHCNDYYLMDDEVEPDYEAKRFVAHNEVKIYPNRCSGADSKSGTDLDSCSAIHAEQNALLQCKDVYDIQSCFVTASPCTTCVKLLMGTSCMNIYFYEEYPQVESKKLWLMSSPDRTWVQIPAR